MISVVKSIAALVLATAPAGQQPSAYDRLSGEAGWAACGVDAVEFERLMDLSFRAFDQDMNGGWRSVQKRDGCERSAGELIKSYIVYSRADISDSVRTLRWHAGQMFATADHTTEALALFKAARAVKAGKDLDLYAQATIAFLERDKAALIAARNALAAIEVSDDELESRRRFLEENPDIRMYEGFLYEPSNLGTVNGLLACFDKPYREAYSQECNLKAREERP